MGIYNVTVSTLLPGDEDTSNDTLSTVIENRFCQPSMDCSSGIGFRLFSIDEINNPSECEGYADFTNLAANIAPGSINDLTVKTSRGSQYISVWIDFNDDSIFTADEVVVDNYQIAPGQGAGSFTETMDLVIPTNALDGMHRMRAKANYNEPVPDACAVTQYGETEDYTANIGTLEVDDYSIKNADLVITSLDKKEFEITFTTAYEGNLYVAVYNVLGQQIGIKTLNKIGSSYKVKLDMGEAASGVYILKLGGTDTTAYKTGRIIVK